MQKSHWVLTTIICALVIVIILLTKCNNDGGNPVNIKTDTITKWYTADSLLVTSIYQMKDSQFMRMNAMWMDSVATLHGITGRLSEKVKQLTIAITEANAVIPAIDSTIYVHDTITHTVKSMINRYKNQWYDITAQTGKGAYVRLKAFDTVHHAVFRLYSGNIFNRRYYTRTDLSFANKYVQVSGMQTFNVPDYTYALSVQANADAFYMDKDIYGKAGLYVMQENGILHYGGGAGMWMNGSKRNGFYIELKSGIKFTLKKR